MVGTGQADKAFRGNIEPPEAWQILSTDGEAQLVDVRTQAEWIFVGGPDLSGLGKAVLQLEWQVYPGMAQNAQFLVGLARALEQSGAPQSAPLVFICRSGARSLAAAQAAAQDGYGQCFNLAGGFEGDLGSDRHRGSVNGWKASGLPWVQT